MTIPRCRNDVNKMSIHYSLLKLKLTQWSGLEINVHFMYLRVAWVDLMMMKLECHVDLEPRVTVR